MIKIFITGCAKSGTTILLRLFNAFSGLNISCDEMSLDYFITSDYNVAKRSMRSIFSDYMGRDEECRQLDIVSKNNISIVNIIRDASEVIKYRDEKGYGLAEMRKRYWFSVYQAMQYKDYVSCSLSFRDVISAPDATQLIVANKFSLNIKHLWSEYPSFYDDSQEIAKQQMSKEDYLPYTLRKLGEH